MSLSIIDPIHTARLTIRALDVADLRDLQAVNGDAEVTRFLPYEPWAGLADGQAWAGRMQALAEAGTGRQLVIIEAATQRTIGTVLLFRHEPGSARAELGYVLGRAHWGRGLAREAIAAVVTHAFGPMGLRRLEAEVNPANEASNALLRKLGFVHEGVLRQRWVTRGLAYDVNVWGCLAAEWAAPQNQR